MGVNDTGLNQAFAVANAVYTQATGKGPLANVNTGDFVTVGTKLLQLGEDKILGAISELTSKTIFDDRVYTGTYKDMMVSTEEFGAMSRQIDFGDLGMEEDKGYSAVDGQSVDMYAKRNPKVLQTNFYGFNTAEYHITTYKEQLWTAIKNAAEWNALNAAMLNKVNNERTISEEALSQAAINNYIAAIKDAAKAKQHIHLLTEYNAYTGLTLTAETVMQAANFMDFCQWTYGRMQQISRLLEKPSVNFHFTTPDISITKFTPKDKQMIYISEPLAGYFSSRVLSNTRNPGFLETAAAVNYVPYWQSNKAGEENKIMVTPQYYDEADGGIKTASAPVTVDKIMGIIFDRRAIALVNKYNSVDVTPYNARGRYWNTWWNWQDRYINNFVEQAVLFTLD